MTRPSAHGYAKRGARNITKAPPHGLRSQARKEILMIPSSRSTETAGSEGVALVVSSLEEDHAFLERLFSTRSWRFDSVSTVGDGIRYLRHHSPGLLICDERLEDGDWKAILDAVMKVACPPRMIVTSRLADERLWAEVLNLGGYDLLAKPFDASEVVRVVGTAWPGSGKKSEVSYLQAVGSA
jgi:DNA-binding response OmpR family regulator